MIASIALASLTTALRYLAGSGLFERVATGVEALAIQDLPGATKRQRMLDMLGTEAQGAASYLVKAIIEIVLYRLAQR